MQPIVPGNGSMVIRGKHAKIAKSQMRQEHGGDKTSGPNSKLSHIKEDRTTTLVNESQMMQGTYHGDFQAESPVNLTRQANLDKISVKFKIIKNSRFKDQGTSEEQFPTDHTIDLDNQVELKPKFPPLQAQFQSVDVKSAKKKLSPLRPKEYKIQENEQELISVQVGTNSFIEAKRVKSKSNLKNIFD